MNARKHARIAHHQRKQRAICKLNKLLIITLLLIALFLWRIGPVSGATIYVPTQYSTIQAAVDAALSGDTIQVAAGTYYEQITINKTITIIGENPKTTIVDGAQNGTVFYIEDSKNVRITGFTIRNAGSNYSAIIAEREIVGSDYHRIENNIITTSQYGIYFSASDYNKIYNNTITGNSLAGVYINSADNTNITSNIIDDSAYGIRVAASINNKIVNNVINLTSFGVHLTLASTGNIIRQNTITGRAAGIYTTSDTTTIDHNTVTQSAYAIYLYNCLTNQVYYNTILDSSYGIRLYRTDITSSTHNINNNKIVNTDWALEMVNAYGNTFTGNWLQENTYGVYMSSSSSNTFYRNNFVNNDMQAYTGTGTNSWNKTGNGNYWSDYKGIDENHNGIGDTPYTLIPVGRDNYPLMTTWSEHDVTITSVTTSTNQTNPGGIVIITVKVRNNNNISATETFTVTTKYNNTAISTQQVTNLAQGATQILTFTWNTTGVPTGNYTIKAEATTVTNELNTDNNNFTDGTVKINAPLIGDINGDGTINSEDLSLLTQAYGSTLGDPNWNQNADLNKDNNVNISDLNLLAQNYGDSN